MPIRRRALLATALVASAGALAGCDLAGGEPDAEPSRAPDVLLPLLLSTVALRDRYAAALAAFPGLQDKLGPVRDNHAQHVIALAREIGLPEAGPFPAAPAPSGSAGASAPPTGTPSDQGAAVAALVALEKQGRADAEAACLAAPSYRAELLGSIAAGRAAHAEVVA